MLNIEKFALELSSNPNVIKNIEEEVENCVQMDDCTKLYEMANSTVPAVHIFLCKILEMRIKRKILKLDLQVEIQLVTSILVSKPSYQICEVYSMLGLYCWPALMPDFLINITLLFNSTTGYQILLLFLEKVNSDTTIDDKRRTELKKALVIVQDQILEKFQKKFASLIIPIYTEFLRILPKNLDFSIVFETAVENPDEAISFFVEGIQYFDSNRIVDLLDDFPADSTLVLLLTNIKKVRDSTKIYNYVFRCLNTSQECFRVSIDFWQRTFSSKSFSNMVIPVLSLAMERYLISDEEVKEDVEQTVFGFFTIITKNYPEIIVSFIKSNGDSLPQKIVANFIQKLLKSEDSIKYLNSLSFKSNYLECLIHFLRDDPVTKNLIFSLDFKDKDSVKLGLSLIEKYPYSTNELAFILKMCDESCINANEIKVECFVRLGMHESFGVDWSMDSVVKYFYYLKKSFNEYVQYKDYFYSLFIQNAPFDRCFSICDKIGSVPPFILQSIYDKMDKYPFIELCCFNNDLLPSLENPKPFIRKEVNRFIAEWHTIKDHKDYYMAVKSLLTVFSGKIDKASIVDDIIELIQIDSGIILNKILSLFNSYTGEYNTGKAVYYLISAYNLPNVSNSQPFISASLTECMYREDGPLTFHNILGVDINRCFELKLQLTKVNKRTAQNMVRDLIKDFRGKPFNKMFETEEKVTKQDFLPPKTKTGSDYSLKNVNFL